MKRLTKRITNLATSAVNQMGHDYIQVDDMDEAMEKLFSYEDTGLEPEEIGEIAEKEEPKKVEEVALPYGKGFECKNCGNELSVNEFNGIYCHWCGQKLDW